MTRYREHRKSRMGKIRRLATFGLPIAAIAEALGITSATVSNDVQALTATQQLTGRWGQRTYGEHFLLFARVSGLWQHRYHELSSLDAAERELLVSILRIRLRIQWIQEAVQQIAQIMYELMQPKTLPEQRGYARLLEAVFGKPRPNDQPRSQWEDYLSQLAEGTVSPPATPLEAIATVREAYFEKYRPLIAPIWTPDVSQKIDRVLESLPDELRRVLVERFGLREEPKTLAETGARLGKRGERVRQIESHALRWLRHPKRANQLRRFVEPFGDSLRLQLERETEVARQQDLGESLRERIFLDLEVPANPWVLLRPVEELELSVRSENCLRGAEIKTFGELVAKSEAEMLRYRNFGKKSLRELQDVMAEYGLRFGMKLHDDWEEVLRRER